MTASTDYVTITRTFAAPRDLVYQAFIDPDQIAQWFGPVGWSVPRDTIDVDARVGGHQRLTMVNEEDASQQSPVNATFTEVIENELLVGSEEFNGVPGVMDAGTITMRIEFSDDGDGTRVVITQGPFPPAAAEMTTAGWHSSFTKLDTSLAAA